LSFDLDVAVAWEPVQVALQRSVGYEQSPQDKAVRFPRRVCDKTGAGGKSSYWSGGGLQDAQSIADCDPGCSA
jgi:hypothetical protein